MNRALSLPRTPPLTVPSVAEELAANDSGQQPRVSASDGRYSRRIRPSHVGCCAGLGRVRRAQGPPSRSRRAASDTVGLAGPPVTVDLARDPPPALPAASLPVDSADRCLRPEWTSGTSDSAVLVR